jgi:hypothetical protein
MTARWEDALSPAMSGDRVPVAASSFLQQISPGVWGTGPPVRRLAHERKFQDKDRGSAARAGLDAPEGGPLFPEASEEAVAALFLLDDFVGHHGDRAAGNQRRAGR